MTGSRAARIVEVAARAGVAPSTVSYVLSGKRAVSEQLRERVLRAVTELNYRPHGPARSLASGNASRSIGLFVPSLASKRVSAQQMLVVAGAMQAASECGYALPLSTTPSDPRAIAHLIERGDLDGAILMETLAHDPRIALLRERRYPFTLIGQTIDNDGISFVDLDFAEAIGQSVRHLAALGHRCIALFNFAEELLQAGFMAALVVRHSFEASTAELELDGIHLPCPRATDAAARVANSLFAEHPACTAAITTGWHVTGVLAAAADRGLSIPDDFSLTSIIASEFAGIMRPPLTGIDWPSFDAGLVGAKMLIDQLTAPHTRPQQTIFPGELVLRESTAPPRRARSRR